MSTKQAKPKIDDSRALKKAPANQDRTLENQNDPNEARAIGLPRVKLSNNRVQIDHPDQKFAEQQLMQAFGTDNRDFMFGMLRQLVNAAVSFGPKANEIDINFMISSVAGLKPRDHFEAMLLAQSVAVHVATMSSANHLANAETIGQQDSAERLVNKLARTFLNLMEGLKRYRTAVETVTVQNVQVRDGGQAIVGNITQNAAPTTSNEAPASPPALFDARAVPMEIIDDRREPELARTRRKASP